MRSPESRSPRDDTTTTQPDRRKRRTPGQDSAGAPVVLAQVVVTVTDTGALDVAVDGHPFAPPAADQAWTRARFDDLLDAITQDRTVPVRVEVREADGTVFTDIIHTRRPTALEQAEAGVGPEARQGRRAKKPGRELVEVTGDGFVPDEDVAVAVILNHTDATGTGHVHALLDPRDLAHGHATMAEECVLLGRVSGTVKVRRLP